LARWTLTARIRGKVERRRFDELGEALGALERRGHELQGRADADVVGGSMMRRFQPEDQVTARLELSGPGVNGGVDVRGDGTAVPFTGRLRRTPVQRGDGESAYDALRRVLAPDGSDPR
jgi:hypothetical protein